MRISVGSGSMQLAVYGYIIEFESSPFSKGDF
jgi:hypothetical protein